MKILLLAIAMAAALGMAVPASAQVRFEAGPGGIGVDVGPRYDRPRHHRWHGAYARGDCRVIREKVVTPRGRVIYRTREECY